MESLTNHGRSSRVRGVATVEFALLLVAIVVSCAAGVRVLGHSVARAAAEGTTALGGSVRETRVLRLPRDTDPSRP